MELTTRQAAERLGVNQSRVRALISSRALAARRAGSQWLVDADSVERQASLTAAKATGRSMSARVAWAAGDLADGGTAAWLSSDERSRLRRRLRGAASADVLQRWLSSRATATRRFRIGEGDVEELLGVADVVRTGLSAVGAYRLGLGTGSAGDAYVTGEIAEQLIKDYFLIEASSGNLTLRVVDHGMHLLTARRIGGLQVATRLMVGADLAGDRSARAKTTGRGLLEAVRDEQAAQGQRIGAARASRSDR